MLSLDCCTKRTRWYRNLEIYRQTSYFILFVLLTFDVKSILLILINWWLVKDYKSKFSIFLTRGTFLNLRYYKQGEISNILGCNDGSRKWIYLWRCHAQVKEMRRSVFIVKSVVLWYYFFFFIHRLILCVVEEKSIERFLKVLQVFSDVVFN